ncbi:MAG: hypothetical protein RMJ56_14385 [Gemmataceae bacterium]|nr:hypothetical protein [Gemmata sp.]MDW8198782.1 hypothetical protein [Gemmataceae bacterium]
MDVRPLSAWLAAGVLILGSGCTTLSTTAQQKPDITQPGVLPPPQELAQQNAAAASGVVPAGGSTAATPVPAVASGLPKMPNLANIATQLGFKTQPSELALGWRNRVAYLPDPARQGVMSPGLVGQMFLFGYNGSKLEFVEADGILTVDVIDKTPRPPGATPLRPERWQFNTEMLKRLQTVDETFGRSYVLFLPWPAYRPDVTRVEISARFDPSSGHTLYSPPSILTLENTPHNTPVWGDMQKSSRPLNMANKPPLIQPISSHPLPNTFQPTGTPGAAPGTPGAAPGSPGMHIISPPAGAMPSASPPWPGALSSPPVVSPAPVSTSPAAPATGTAPAALPPPPLSSSTATPMSMSVVPPMPSASLAPAPPPGLPPIAISVNR